MNQFRWTNCTLRTLLLIIPSSLLEEKMYVEVWFSILRRNLSMWFHGLQRLFVVIYGHRLSKIYLNLTKYPVCGPDSWCGFMVKNGSRARHTNGEKNKERCLSLCFFRLCIVFLCRFQLSVCGAQRGQCTSFLPTRNNIARSRHHENLCDCVWCRNIKMASPHRLFLFAHFLAYQPSSCGKHDGLGIVKE